jgi:tocopherol O-methyltransferase
MDSNDRQITIEQIRSYYSQTSIDYWTAWLNGENLSMHFGYQETSATSHATSLTRSIEVLSEIAEISSGDQVLDAGCGIGGSSLWLAKEKQARVVGIALGPDQIDAARREAKRRGCSAKAQFLVADFTRLPFAAESFDVVWAQESLCHANEKAAFFNEAARVLAPGGRVVVSDFMLRRASVSPEDRLLLEEWLDGWALPELWTAAQHANAARTAGLRDISINDITNFTLPSHRRLYQRAQWALPVAKLLRLTGFRDSVQEGNFVASLRQYQTLRRNCWFYAILSARKV